MSLKKIAIALGRPTKGIYEFVEKSGMSPYRNYTNEEITRILNGEKIIDGKSLNAIRIKRWRMSR